MSQDFIGEYHGISLRAISEEIDHLFGFPSEWTTDLESEDGCYEHEGKIVLCTKALDKLCEEVEAGPGDRSHVVRYVMAHLKTHHFQENNPTYAKPHSEDPRPYEIEADMAAGWICANAQLQNSFGIHHIAPKFNDFKRAELTGSGGSTYTYPWPAERDEAFFRGARMWVAGRLSLGHNPGVRLGIPDQSFLEFLFEAPIYVNNQWSRQVPEGASAVSFSNQGVHLEDRVPVASTRIAS